MNEKGFTFIEMLVVLFLFTIVIVTATDIFVRSQRNQTRAASEQRLQDNLRFAINKITNDVRTGGIDYSCYRKPDNTLGGCAVDINSTTGNRVLALRDARGKSLRYRISETIGQNECLDAKSAPCLLVSDTAGVTWQSVLQKGMRLDVAKSTFYIRPAKDPFFFDASASLYLSNMQPTVTMTLEAHTDIAGIASPTHLGVQTTATTREYRR